MAFTTLTNAKTIQHLGPNRSILSAIIRPDAVLLERKGGSNGKLTFDNIFPGNGEPLERLNGDDHQEIYCNWALNDEEEESLPRGGRTPRERKRTASRDGRSSKKAKVHATPTVDSHKNGSV